MTTPKPLAPLDALLLGVVDIHSLPFLLPVADDGRWER